MHMQCRDSGILPTSAAAEAAAGPGRQADSDRATRLVVDVSLEPFPSPQSQAAARAAGEVGL